MREQLVLSSPTSLKEPVSQERAAFAGDTLVETLGKGRQLLIWKMLIFGGDNLSQKHPSQFPGAVCSLSQLQPISAVVGWLS